MFVEIRHLWWRPTFHYKWIQRSGNGLGSDVYTSVSWYHQIMNYSPSFSAELYALILVLRRIDTQIFTVHCSTALFSSLQSLSHVNTTHHRVSQLLQLPTDLLHNRKSVILCWIPSHMVSETPKKLIPLTELFWTPCRVPSMVLTLILNLYLENTSIMFAVRTIYVLVANQLRHFQLFSHITGIIQNIVGEGMLYSHCWE